MARAYIGIGSNLGDPPARVRAGIEALRALGEVVAVSSLYRSAPWGRGDQPSFVNAAVVLETALAPHALLRGLKRAERDLGRVAGERWGPREIDLDILDYEGVELHDEDLTIPHRHLAERAFALVPLAQIAPRYAALRDALGATERDAVEPFDG
ncbi:MAG: 2-amino-4-hydroxy-6-hydroxymethyldihydropteridine diphosphokinase [bacterium]|nr:2-amino-4-hydroxy-6-hydroxymethyldihydropteridine diphosphokinase [bacterium]